MAANLYKNLLSGECIVEWCKNGRNYNPYESKQFFKNDSNGHDCCFLKCYYYNIWIMHAQSPTNLSKSMWKFIFNVIDVIL
jgi:hypothetical protein